MESLDKERGGTHPKRKTVARRKSNSKDSQPGGNGILDPRRERGGEKDSIKGGQILPQKIRKSTPDKKTCVQLRGKTGKIENGESRHSHLSADKSFNKAQGF